MTNPHPRATGAEPNAPTKLVIEWIENYKAAQGAREYLQFLIDDPEITPERKLHSLAKTYFDYQPPLEIEINDNLLSWAIEQVDFAYILKAAQDGLLRGIKGLDQ